MQKALVLWLLALVCAPVFAKEPLTLGVLSFRSPAETTQKWKPLEDYLNTAVPEYTFTVKAMNLTQMRDAVAQTQVDLVLTQPAEYVRMTHQNGLSAPLATLINGDSKPVRVFGGTMVTRATEAAIVTIADLQDRTVAAPSKDSFAGYQLQAFIFKTEGVRLGNVIETGLSQDDAIFAVLQAKADVAFVRSGLVEGMVRDGKVTLDQIKMIHLQNFPGYPFAISTSLYPEWPVVALPHVRDETAARVAGALLSLPHRGVTTRQIGIYGFSVPSDYESVRAVMRMMKTPPFDVRSTISLADVWQDYKYLILAALASLVAIAAFAARSTLLGHRLRELNETLESRIAERTSELAGRNTDLAKTLDELRLTRDELVESAKLAALGSLVAGIAHELNTPVGNGLTVASSLEEKAKSFQKEVAVGIKRSTLDAFVADCALASDILVRNLQKAATLVTSFKQVAVDQTSSQRRTFRLHDTLQEVILTLSPTLKRSGCKVTLVEPETDVRLDSYPGPLGQVVSNLINNSVFHGYADREPGQIRVTVSCPDADHVTVEVADDGHGISEANLGRIFDPFFTTRLGSGGSGLGLSIAHNLVGGPLGGRLTAVSVPGQGATFAITVPLQAPAV